jgi:hypothetical protein
LIEVIVKKLTFAEVFAGLADLFPGVELEIGGLVDSLSCDFSVVLIIEGENSAEEQVLDDSQTPKIYLFSIGLLQ